MFFKIESWNFQNQFEKEFRETSQSFNSIRQPIEKHENNNCLNQPNELKWHPNFQWRFWSEPAAMTTFFARNENLGKLRKRPLTWSDFRRESNGDILLFFLNFTKLSILIQNFPKHPIINRQIAPICTSWPYAILMRSLRFLAMKDHFWDHCFLLALVWIKILSWILKLYVN